MTENEALKLGKSLYENITINANNIIPTKKYIEFVRMANEALEEIQQYRAIGTVEEFKALEEKSVAKKVADDLSFFKCPSCESWEIEEFYETGSSNKHNYCPDCGQKLDWQ